MRRWILEVPPARFVSGAMLLSPFREERAQDAITKEVMCEGVFSIWVPTTVRDCGFDDLE